MKFRVNIIILLSIFLLINISIVCANDNITLNDSLESDEVDEIVLNSSQEDILEEDVGTFTDLSNLVNTGSSIKLTKDYKMRNGEKSVQLSKSDIVIDGQGHTLDGNNLGNIFSVSGTNIVFKNITFINGNGENGGAIGDFYGNGKQYTVINCIFENNSASNCGGALYAQYSPINVYDSVFLNNRNNGYWGGGAIFSDRNIYVDGCEFYGNSIAQGEGSAIKSSKGLVSISNSIFPEVQEGKSHILGSSYQLSNNYLSFSELNNLIANSNGELNLENDYLFIKGYDTGALTISKSITINGNGHVIDANKSTNIFKVTSNNVILRNMILTNAYLYEVNNIGVAVSWSGSNGLLDNVTIINSSFGSSRNAGSYNWWNTGMIYWNGQNGMVDNLKLISNTVASSKGMIIWLGSNGSINNSYFSNCSNTYNSHVGYSQATSFFIYWNAVNGKFLNSIVKNLSVSTRNVVNPFYVSFVKQGHVENVSFVDCQRSNRDQTLYDLNMPFTPVEDYVKDFNGNFNKHTPTITLDKNIVTVKSVRSGSVTYTIGADFSKTTNVDKNGQFTLDYKFTPSQNYLIKVLYNENDYYTSCAQYFDYNSGDESSFGSFTDLNNLIQSSSSSIINLSKNYVYDPIKDSALSGGITISKSITINGNNHFIDADYNAVRIFTTKVNVILNNITFKNSRLNSPGNAVLANAQIEINYCIFDNNWAYGQYGGAIKLSGDSSYVKYCTFTNNKALTGAAIVVNSNNNYILHSYFRDNVKDYGGAMNYGSDISVTGGKSAYVNYNAFLDYRPLRQISAEYSRDNWYGINSLPDSSASGAPGISNYLKASLNYEIKNNDLTLGILFTESDTGNIVNIKWVNNVIYTIGSNSIISDTLSTVKYSGVTSNVLINAVLDNQRLTNQNSKAWYVKTTGSDSNSGTESSPYKTLSKALQSASNGDIIYVAPGTYVGSNNVKLTISKSVTIDRWGNSGDVIFDGQGSRLIFTLNSNVVLSSLTLKNGKGSSGGALVIKSDSVIIDCTFVDNVATSWGGAIDMNPGDAIIINSRFINNNATLGGGAISTADVNLNIFNCIFTDNHGGRGGAINSGNTAANINVVGSTFKSNTADSYGGALIFDGTGNITDSVFINNSAICGGGAVYFWGYDHMISNSKFINNSAVDGGAVIALCTNLTSFNNHFDNNIAQGFGGAIYGTSGDFLIYNDVFSNNIVYYDGGAVYIYKGIGSIYESLFKRNLAGYGGGAAHLLASDLLCKRLGLLNNVSTYLNGQVNTDYLNSFIDFGNYTLVVADTSNYKGTLPSYFSLADNGWDTAVKNQGSLGICWDYAVIATVETAIKKATGVEVDLSENNVKNLISMYSIYGTGRNPNSGGVVWDALSYLANSLGPVYENLDKTGSFGFSPLLSNSYHISNIAFASRSRDRPLDNDEVKEAIIKYGAVRVSINMDDNHKGYNYYHSTNTGTNHAIALVGWDDNYSRSNFPDGCPGDGAWIVKNSWGPNSGKNGYIYVSYYDQTFAWSGLAYIIFNDTIQYNRVYQYDYSNYGMKSTGNSISWYKNIYTSVNNEGLAAFSTYFNEKTDWEVFVYVGDELKHTQSGSSMGNGYFTFNFDKIIPVAKGSQFSIALKVNNANIPYVSKNLNTLSCGAGVSYYSKDGVTWNDLDKNNQVACLKVFTQNMFGSLLSVDSVADVVYGRDVVVNFDVINRTTVSYSVFSNDGRLIREGSNIKGDKVILSNLDAGEYTINILNENSADYVGCVSSAKFTVNKAGSSISISPVSSVVYGNNVNIKFNSVNASKLSYVVKNKGTGAVVVAKTAISNLNNFNIGVLDVGVYTVVISNDETANYMKSEASAQFSITKASPNLSVTVSNVVYPNDVVVKVKSDVAGSYAVKVGDQSKSVSLISNVESSVVFSNLGADNYSINMDYSGTVNYDAVSWKGSVVVFKAASNVSISSVDSVVYPNVVNVVFSVVNPTIVSYVVKSNSGNVVVSNTALTSLGKLALNLGAGDYMIFISNEGNENYTGNIAQSSFSVLKATPKITLSTSNVVYPNDVVVKVKSDVAGSYAVKVGGQSKSVSLKSNVESSVVFSNLGAGDYSVNVDYTETANYNHAYKSSDVKVVKASSNVSINKINAVSYPNNVNVVYKIINRTDIDVKVKNVKTNVEITVPASNITNTNILIGTLDAGEYLITLNNTGNVNYDGSFASSKFTINKYSPKIEVNAVNVIYPSDVVVNVKSDVSGKYIVKIADETKEVTLFKGQFQQVIFKGLNADENGYKLNVSYLGDGNYNAAFNESIVKVFKASSSVDIVKFTNGVYDTLVPVINVNFENKTSVTYTIYKNGVKINSNPDINSLLLDLPVGEYSLSVTNAGDDNHNSSNDNVSFKVLKANSKVSINQITNVTYNSPITVNFNVNNKTSVNYLVKTAFGEIIVKNTTIMSNSIVISNLSSGSYVIVISNAENDCYNGDSNSAEFTVNKAINDIEVIVSNKVLPGDVTVMVKADVDGVYKVNIGNFLINVTVDSGVGFAKINLPAHNNYIASTDFSDNQNYTVNIKEAKFSVSKGINNIKIEVNSTTYPNNVSIKLKADVSGEYDVVLSNGKIIKVYEGIPKSIQLDAGEYIATVNYHDDNYEGVITNASFKVLKANNTVKVRVANVKYNESALINVSADVDGDYIVNINGSEVTVTVANGNGFAYSKHLTKVGKYYASTTFVNSNYDVHINNTEFYVDVAVNNIVISVDDVIYPNKVKVNVNASLKGTYRVYFNNSQYVNVNVGNSLGGFNTIELGAGKYETSIDYYDENYRVNVANCNFEVKKADAKINIDVNDFCYGEDVLITFTTDVSGLYNVSVGNHSEIINVAERTSVNVGKLNVGKYNVSVVFLGNDNYTSKETKKEFKVTLNDPCLIVYGNNVTYGQNVVLTHEIAKDATGYINYTYMDGKLIKKVNINESFEIMGLTVGNYTILAKYSGDLNYKSFEYSMNLTVKKAVNNIEVDAISQIYPDNVTIKLTADVYGNYLVVLSDGEKFIMPSNSSRSIQLDAGEYIAAVDYHDDNYEGVITNASFKVLKANNDVVVKIDDVCYLQKAIIYLTASVDGNYTVSLSNGEIVVVEVVNNKGFNLTTPLTSIGLVYANVTFEDTVNYNVNIKNSCFEVKKAINNIEVSVDSVVYPGNVTVKVNADIFDNYTVDINGTQIKVNGDGFATINLPAGLYYANITGYSSSFYEGVYNNVVFVVEKGINFINVTTEKSHYGYGDEIVVNIVSDVKDNYTLIIDETHCLSVPVLTESGDKFIGFTILPWTFEVGEYGLTVNWSNPNYVGCVGGGVFSIVKADNHIEVEVDSVSYPHNVSVKVKADIKGVYAVDINGTIVNVSVGDNGIGFTTISLKPGYYSANIMYNSNKYVGLINNDSFEVLDGVIESLKVIVGDVDYSNNVSIIVLSSVDGEYSVCVNDKTYHVIVLNGTGICDGVDLLDVGQYEAVVMGNISNYNYIFNSTSFEVRKVNPVVTIPDIEFVYGEIGKVRISGNVSAYVIDHPEAIVHVVNDILMISNLDAGFYRLNMTFVGDKNHNDVSKIVNVTVDRVYSWLQSGNVTVKYMAQPVVLNVSCENAIKIAGYLYDVDGNLLYNLTSLVDENIILPKLGVGVYSMVLSTVVDSNHVSVSKEYFVCILNEDVVVGKIDVNKKLFYLQSNKCSVRILDSNNNPVNGVNVEFRVNNKVCTVKSDKNGFVHITPNLKPGTYTLSIIVGNKSISNKIVVKHIVVAKNITKIKKSVPKTFIKITVKGHNVKQTVKVKFTYKGKNKVKVKFGKVMKKQTVTVKFKGKTYNVKVNVKGVGTIKLAKKTAKKLKRGKYTTKVNYKGPKLYKKVKVTVKFNGKKYKVKTNKCGVAKFKVTKKMVKKFKKGKKVKYTITYMADKLNRYVKIK